MNYEFTKEQNDRIAGLASKMKLVGLVSIVLGVLLLIAAVLLLAAIFQDKLPADVVSKIPEEVRSQIPANNYLWAIFAQSVVVGIVFLLIGVWTRSSAASFQDIVATTGRDISHLMGALDALHKMYSLLYTVIVLIVLAVVVFVGLQLYLKYAA